MLTLITCLVWVLHYIAYSVPLNLLDGTIHCLYLDIEPVKHVVSPRTWSINPYFGLISKIAHFLFIQCLRLYLSDSGLLSVLGQNTHKLQKPPKLL